MSLVSGCSRVPLPVIRLFYSPISPTPMSFHQFPEGDNVCCPFPTNKVFVPWGGGGAVQKGAWQESFASSRVAAVPLPGADTARTLIFLQEPSEVPGERAHDRVQISLLFGTPGASRPASWHLAFIVWFISSHQRPVPLPQGARVHASFSPCRILLFSDLGAAVCSVTSALHQVQRSLAFENNLALFCCK